MQRYLLSNFSIGERIKSKESSSYFNYCCHRLVYFRVCVFELSANKVSPVQNFNSYGNNGAAAFLLLAQFKALVMKGGFMVIIRHANVSGCYALEQGTCPGLIAREPRRHFLAFAYGEGACLEKYI